MSDIEFKGKIESFCYFANGKAHNNRVHRAANLIEAFRISEGI